MSQLLGCQKLSKSFRSRPLFENLSFSMKEGERLGVVGPNGAGKSTLMKILSGLERADSGSIASKKDLRVSYLAQEDEFRHKTVNEVLRSALSALKLAEHEEQNRIEKILSRTGLDQQEQTIESLSGGWRKRLAIAQAIISEPDLLLLDEPTNHLDLEGVLWLEKLLLQSRISTMFVSHDRQFLENLATRMLEINPLYEDGCLSVSGSYSDLLQARQEYQAAQANQEQALASKLRREIAWLRRGARARQTKSSHRIKEAAVLAQDLAEVKDRNQTDRKIAIDFESRDRQSKELLTAKKLSKSFASRKLFSGLDILLGPSTRLGLIGANGSGKTTLLKILSGEIAPDSGEIKRANDLRIVFFDQQREQLDQSQTLWKSLCPDGDSVHYQGRSVHVSTWARRFLFKPDQLHMPISYLSGGEQARILIANLMRQPADLLILDEPTNNLDLPSLEVLEESLLEFKGAVILVSHDRYMMHEVANLILALDMEDGCRYFADYEQFEQFAESKESKSGEAEKNGGQKTGAGGPRLTAGESLQVESRSRRSGLSTSEKKELAEIELKIEEAEKLVSSLTAELSNPKFAASHEKLLEIQKQVDQASEKVSKLYERWQDLENRNS